MSYGPVLVTVSVDPETSHRANEAVRIALGIRASDTDVRLVLIDAGVKMLDAGVEDYVDGEEIVRHLGTLKRLDQVFHVERAALRDDPGWNPLGVRVEPVDLDGLAVLVGASRRALVF